MTTYFSFSDLERLGIPENIPMEVRKHMEFMTASEAPAMSREIMQLKKQVINLE